jgi:glycosyltransferase involved in cell wall biosynthesis
MHTKTVAVVLPPRESFSPAAAGAISLLVHRLAANDTGWRTLVLGPPAAAPYADVAFRPVRPAFRLAPQATRYAAGVLNALGGRPPTLLEVHNRPDVALWLADRVASPVLLVLHNEPSGMRRARTPVDCRYLLGNVARVATASAYLRDRLLDGIEPPRDPVVLPNSIDLAAVPAPAARENVLLFAGRVVADKGADAFVAACARALPRLPGWRAEIIGADRFGADSPDTPFLRDLRPRAAAADVTLRGYLPHDQVLAALSRAAIAVVPSRWPEPFGMVALEAMACGTPLLCSARGALPEVTADAALRIDPDDPDALADAMVALAGDPARRAAMSEAGRTRAALFDVEPALARLHAVRRDVVAAWLAGEAVPI